jgi:uncharacterized iron-regulated protein
MTRAMLGCLLLVAVSPAYIQVSGDLDEAKQIAVDHLESQGVLLPVAVACQYIAAPVSGYLVDLLGYQGEMLTVFRVGVTDAAGENPGSVFASFHFSSDSTWFPALDSSPEELLAYEFLLDDREEFMALAFSTHPMMTMPTPPGTILTPEGAMTAIAMIAALDPAEVVFVGEQHDDPLAHQWELFLWTALASRDRALALEMFETDVQPLLDRYLSGGISREEFLAGSRPWINYEMDYEPLVKHAAELGLRIIAANVPRSFAAMVAMGGFPALEGTGFEEITIDSSNASYHDRFLETMEAVGGEMHSMPVDPENLYRAQLLKDAVMASSIAGQRCVFVCGRFHSDYFSGIPDQLPPETTFRTVTILREGEPVDFSLADFIIVP